MECFHRTLEKVQAFTVRIVTLYAVMLEFLPESIEQCRVRLPRARLESNFTKLYDIRAACEQTVFVNAITPR